MKTTNLVLIAVLAATVACTGFQFDLSKCKIEKFDAWDQITFPCIGGSNNLDYSFDKLPKNWFASRGKVYAPKGEIDSPANFALRVSVFDKDYNRYLKRCILFNFKNRSFKNIFDTDYDFDIDNKFNVDDFIFKRGGRDIDNFKPITPQVPVYIRPSYDFPSENEIEAIIIKGDVAWIKRIINDAINSGLQCKVISDFLSRVLTLIQSHISIFRNNAEIIRQDIYKLREELNFLLSQLQALEGSSLDISALQRKLTEFRAEIELSFQQKASFEAKIAYNQDQIDENQRQIFTISETIIRNIQLNVDSENENIQRADDEIQGLQFQLDLLRKSRQVSINNRDQYLRKLGEARGKTELLIRANERLQGVIFELRAEFTALEARIASIQLKIEETERQINNIGFGKDAEIREIKLRINEIKSQINAQTNEARNIELIYSALEGSLEEFQRIINKHYYSCYKGVQTDDGDDSVAAAPSEGFLTYLKQVFGSTPDPNIRARFGGETINIKHSTIFSPSWIKVYGIPFSAGYGNNMDIMETDFKCEEVADLQVFSGRIESITRNVINVKDKHGDSYTVHLGGCTRLETATKHNIPTIGDEVYWKGSKRRNGKGREFNGYHFTCY